MNVLIADGSVQITERLTEIIATENISAIISGAATYEQAFLLFKETRPAVVLIGMNLPGDGSMDLLHAIKETGYLTSIIILSIHMSKAVMEQCQLLGATAFLDKFLEFEKIPGIINSLVNKVLK